MISGFCSDAGNIRTLLGYYMVYSCKSLLAYQDNLSVPSTRSNKYVCSPCVERVRYDVSGKSI